MAAHAAPPLIAVFWTCPPVPNTVSTRGLAQPPEFAIIRDLLERWMSGLSRPYLFSGPNWLYGAFAGKISPNEIFAQFCLKSPLKFIFPKNSFSV